MLILGPDPGSGFANQGYDSRCRNYKPELTVTFPCKLDANRSLISTISGENYQKDKKGEPALATPWVICMQNSKLGRIEFVASYGSGIEKPKSTLPVAPGYGRCPHVSGYGAPGRRFSPTYVGKEKPLYETKDIHWDLLPKLKPVPATPDWAVMEQVLSSVHGDHVESWLVQYSMPRREPTQLRA